MTWPHNWLYIVDELGNPKSVTNPLEWENWCMQNDRHIARTKILDVYISTVFLGINHNWIRVGAPILWETMIFAPQNEGLNLRQWRYTSREDALEGHELAVKMVKRIVEG